MFFIFTRLPGEDEPILTSIFQVGWFNRQIEKGSCFKPTSINGMSRVTGFFHTAQLTYFDE